MTFIRYKVDDFGYCLWDYENHKIMSRDVVFNENVMYKDQLQGNKEENENRYYKVLDEIKENKVPKAPENQEQQQVPKSPATIRKSMRLSRPHERFSPSLYYLLMTDSGEPECYEKEMKVETRKKWEKGMNEEMDSLVRNWAWYLFELPLRIENCIINVFTG